MRIVIVGLGTLGSTLAQQLDDEGHQVLAVDIDEKRVRRAQTTLDIMALNESGFHLRNIEEANVRDADLLIAVTGSDEVNLITCLLARKFGIPRHITRIASSALIKELGEVEALEFINPLQVTAERLETMVKSVGTTDSREFVNGAIALRALLVEPGCKITGTPLHELRNDHEFPFIVAAVKRSTDFFMPRGDTVLYEGDTIYVVLERPSLEGFLDHYGFQPSNRRVIVYGASPLSIDVCHRLEEDVSDLILIEPDEAACEVAAQTVTRGAVIQGSPFEKDVLRELKAESADYFMALSANDEGNLAAALMAKRLGTRTVVTLTSQPEYVEIFEPLPHLDLVVSPVFLSVGAILRRVRSGRVHSLAMIAGRRGEALDIEVLPGAPVDGKLVKDVDFPPGMILAAVCDADGARLPTGDTLLEGGQRVIGVMLREVVSDVMPLFGT